MDSFMTEILKHIVDHGSRAVRVFPPASQVLLLFADRVANEVVRILTRCFSFLPHTETQIGDYITTLLAHARGISVATFLKATAASFREAWRLADAIIQAASQRPEPDISRNRAEDVV